MNYSQTTEGAGGVARVQTALRINVPDDKQFYFHLKKTQQSLVLSQKPSQKFPNNNFTHNSFQECPPLVEWFADAARATNHLIGAPRVAAIRLEVLVEGGMQPGARGGRESLAGAGRLWRHKK